MARFSFTAETGSNVTAGTFFQMLMPAARWARLVAVNLVPMYTASPQNMGTWAIQRISAIEAAGSAFTPKTLDDLSGASAITSTTQVYATTVNLAPTIEDAVLVGLCWGWNNFDAIMISSGVNKGFALSRMVAASGALVTQATVIWDES